MTNSKEREKMGSEGNKLLYEVEGTIMEIDWVDSGGQEGRVWDFKEDYTWSPHVHKSIGYFLSVTDDYCYIAQSESADQWGRVFRIPVSCIKKVRDIPTPSSSEEEHGRI